MAADEVVRGAVGIDGVSSEAERGDFDLAVPLLFALRNGDAVLEIPGVFAREGGLLGRLMVGLSHEEKKSSPSAAGVFEPLVAIPSVASVITTSSGDLFA